MGRIAVISASWGSNHHWSDDLADFLEHGRANDCNGDRRRRDAHV